MHDASATQLLGAGVGNTLVVPKTSIPLPAASVSDSSSEIEYGPGGFGKNTSGLTPAAVVPTLPDETSVTCDESTLPLAAVPTMPGAVGSTSASNCKLFVFTKLAKFNVSDVFVPVPMGPHVTLTALRNSRFGVFGWLKLMSLIDTVSVCVPVD